MQFLLLWIYCLKSGNLTYNQTEQTNLQDLILIWI